MRKGLAVLCLLLLSASCRGRPAEEIVLLDEETIGKYIRTYAVIGPVYRKAYEAGASPTAIHRREDIRRALEEVGWSWERFQNVHGSVSNALLYIDDPEAFRRLEMKDSDAPARNVRIVEAHYFEIKRLRLITDEETYGGRRQGGRP